jgi:hypothetical protein
MKWTDDKIFTGRFENDKPIHGKVSYVAGKIAFKGELQVDAAEIGQKIKIGERSQPLWGGKPVIGYDGYILNGTPHGKGTVFFVDGCSYEGDIIEGTMHGQGKYTDTDDGIYEGGFKDNKKSGRGIYTTYGIDDEPDEPDEIIDGNWENGMRQITYEWSKDTDKVIKIVYVKGRRNQTKEVNSESHLTEVREALDYVTNSTIKFRLQNFRDIIRETNRHRGIIKEAAEIQNYKSKYPPKTTRLVRGTYPADALYEYMKTNPPPVSSPDVPPVSSPDVSPVSSPDVSPVSPPDVSPVSSPDTP